jgi:hypothetical protein
VTERQAPLTAECLSCSREFEPRKFGHVFCSSVCRHRGERRPEEREPADPEQVARLFDEGRDPDEQVRPDDWHPAPSEFDELDAGDTVAMRRRWYGNLLREGLA